MPKKLLLKGDNLQSTPFSGIYHQNRIRLNLLESLSKDRNARIDIGVNKRFPDGYYLLHHALLADEIAKLNSGISEEHSIAAELVQKLISRGANPCLQSGPNLYTPTHIAAYNDDLLCLRALVEREESINTTALLTTNSTSHTPFQVALLEGSVDVVTYLLEKVTNLESATDIGMFAGLTEMDDFKRSKNKFFVKLHNLAQQRADPQCGELVSQKLQELGLGEQIEEELSKKKSFSGFSFSFRNSQKKSEKYKATDVVPHTEDHDQENEEDAHIWEGIIGDTDNPGLEESIKFARNASRKQTLSASPAKPKQSESIFDCLRNLTKGKGQG